MHNQFNASDMKKIASLFFLFPLLFCSCKKETVTPLRVRYLNQTDVYLKETKAALLVGDGYTPVGTIAPGAFSNWVTTDSLVLYSTGPYHYLEGQTETKPFTAYAFHDCLTGATPVIRRSGELTFVVRPWEYIWAPDTSKIHLELRLEE